MLNTFHLLNIMMNQHYPKKQCCSRCSKKKKLAFNPEALSTIGFRITRQKQPNPLVSVPPFKQKMGFKTLGRHSILPVVFFMMRRWYNQQKLKPMGGTSTWRTIPGIVSIVRITPMAWKDMYFSAIWKAGRWETYDHHFYDHHVRPSLSRDDPPARSNS